MRLPKISIPEINKDWLFWKNKLNKNVWTMIIILIINTVTTTSRIIMIINIILIIMNYLTAVIIAYQEKEDDKIGINKEPTKESTNSKDNN